MDDENQLCNAFPPLPHYTLQPAEPLVPWMSDFTLSLILPIALYWGLCGLSTVITHYASTLGLRRLHTEAELEIRNRTSKLRVLLIVIRNSVLQTVLGGALGYLQGPDVYGREAYDLSLWAQQIRVFGCLFPRVQSVSRSDLVQGLVTFVINNLPDTALTLGVATDATISSNTYDTAYTDWEIVGACFMYYGVTAAFQFFVAFAAIDTWQYFGHRLLHENKFLYRTVHSTHHQLYVPFCWAAFYMHALESVFLDFVSIAIAFPTAGLTTRQGMCFTAIVTWKAIADHAEVDMPWNPMYLLSSTNTLFHDIHHQTWGLKHNYGIYSPFWDNLMGTFWVDEDTAKAKYEAGRVSAAERLQKRMD